MEISTSVLALIALFLMAALLLFPKSCNNNKAGQFPSFPFSSSLLTRANSLLFFSSLLFSSLLFSSPGKLKNAQSDGHILKVHILSIHPFSSLLFSSLLFSQTTIKRIVFTFNEPISSHFLDFIDQYTPISAN